MRRTLLAVSALLATAAGAQPASQFLDTAPADRLVLPAQDNAALQARAESARQRGTPAPVRFAEPLDVLVQAVGGTWETAGDGTRIWRLAVSSPGAYSLSFGFSRFWLPEGASLWIYPEGGDPEYRPFTHDDNEAHGELWTPIIPGGRAVIEVNLPVSKNTEEGFELDLTQVNHAFTPALLSQEEKEAIGSASQSGSCNVDVVCPEGDGYRDIIQSVGAYTVRGIDFCSGAAVNNTAEDGRPLFLTADHCGITPSNQAAIVVYWNYQSTTCRATGSNASGGFGNGPRGQFNTGAVELGDGPNSDWSVLELDDPILPESRVYYAGWDRRDVAPSSAVAIHHPGVEDKRISFEEDATSITLYSSNAVTSSGTHIRVADWDTGTTEGGSSGSPLFDANKRIVGQLHGGGAACGNNEPDWYGRIYRSMNDGLASILDPGNTGAQTLDGRGVPFAQSTTDSDRLLPGESTTATVYIVNPTGSDVAGSTVTVQIPDGLQYGANARSTYGTVSTTPDEVTWTGTLASGTELGISFDVVAEASTDYGFYELSSVVDLAGDVFDQVVGIVVVTPRPEPTVVYDATPAANIPDASCPSGAISTISVAEDWIVGRVSVGVNVTHTWRGDLDVRLTSPSGTTVLLARGQGREADNLDVLFDDAHPITGLSGSHNASSPFFENESRPALALASFSGERAQGDWTLSVCDGARQDTGRLERWALNLVEQSMGPVSGEEGPQEGPLAATIVGSNPASEVTRVQILSSRPQDVQVTIVDASGREVRRVADRWVSGTVTLDVNLAGLASGTYFVRVQADGERQSLPISVVR